MSTPAGFEAKVAVEAGGRVSVVALTGRLDPLAAEELKVKFEELYAAGDRRFVLDLAGLNYVGSLGIQAFLMLANRVKGDGLVCLCCPTPLVREVFELVRIGTVIRTYPTRRDAVDAARSA